MRNKLHPLSIFKYSYKLSLANVIGYALQIPVSLYVAAKLGPQNYGLVAFVMLWAFYGRLIRPGLLGASGREMPHYIGKGQADSAIYIQNVCVTSEFIYYLFSAAVIIISSFFFKNNVVRVGLVLVAISLIVDLIDSFYTNAQWVFQRFDILARINLLKAVITPLLTFLLVYSLQTYGLLVLPIAVSLFSICCLLFYVPNHNFAITFDYKKLIYLCKVGITLQLLTFLFWAFRGIDRTIIAIYFSAEQLGYYAFAMAFIHNIYKLIADFDRVLGPVMLQELGRAGNALLIQKEFNQLMILLTLAGAAVTNLVQACFGAAIFWLLPKFIPSIAIFEIFAFNIIFTTILIVPYNLLLSSVVNKQRLSNIIYAIASILSILLAYPVVKMGGGPIGIACLFVVVQMMIAISMLVVSKKYLFINKKESVLFGVWTIGILSTAVINYIIFSTSSFKYSVSYVLSPLINRASFTLLCWGTISYIMYRIFTKEKILLKLLKDKIT